MFTQNIVALIQHFASPIGYGGAERGFVETISDENVEALQVLDVLVGMCEKETEKITAQETCVRDRQIRQR